MSRNPFIPPKPTEITLDTLPDLFAHHRARFGGWSMNGNQSTSQSTGDTGAGENGQTGTGTGGGSAAVEPPDGVSEQEWSSLGDAGKQAILRERERANAAERALAASRARPAPPAQRGTTTQSGGDGSGNRSAGQATGQGSTQDTGGASTDTDIAAIVQQAVQAAVKPFVEREEQRETQAAAEKVRTSVLDAAKVRLHDATDALANIDLTTIVNDQGAADSEKVKAALDDLVKRKPHLAKSTERLAPLGIGGGAPAGVTDAEKVKAALADMQRATGIRPESTTTN